MAAAILCYGDSNTYGYDPRSYLGGRYPHSVRWTGLLEDAGYTVRNEGLNGRVIPQGREIHAAVQMLKSIPFQILTVHLGINDLLNAPSLTAGACAERMERFLSALLADRAAIPEQILLAAPPPCVQGTWVQDDRLLCSGTPTGHLPSVLASDLPMPEAGMWNASLTASTFLRQGIAPMPLECGPL